jgi:carboxypeptidase C (cathepsin A)
LTVFSGYLWIREPDDSALAFIFYGSKKATSRDMIPTFPTVIWLSGGPGRSSFSANYLEIGPVIVDD